MDIVVVRTLGDKYVLGVMLLKKTVSTDTLTLEEFNSKIYFIDVQNH